MRIKRLELTGFKSFVDHTVLDFPAGITAIVGPNGVGKSNLVDAVRWVLGEQSPRHLRGQAMEDVIFAGNDRLGPLGMAEVSLLLSRDEEEQGGKPAAEVAEDGLPPELTGATEILITRRYFRSGESEFEINRVPCRLRDITELFLGTGVGTKAYAIVDQGRVEQIVNARPEELRLFVEEAAGTTRFRSRRAAAERKMARTRENLTRVVDVLREIDRQVRTLERQARRAEEHRRWRAELRRLELGVAALRARRWQTEVAERQEKVAHLRQREQAGEEALRQVEEEEASKRAELSGHETTVAARQQELVELRLAMARTQAAHKAEVERLAEVERQLEEAEREAAEIARQQEHLQAEVARAQNEVAALARSRPTAQAEAERLSAEVASTRRSLAAAQEGMEALKDRVHALAAEGARLANVRSALAEERESMRCRRERLRQEEQTRRERLAALAQAVAGASAREAQAEAESSQVAAALVEARREEECSREVLRQREQEAAAAKERALATRSRLASARELVERHEGGAVGNAALAARGTGRPLLDMVQVPPQLQAAVAAAIGARLHHLVVSDVSEALRALEWLAREKQGRASLLLASHPNPPPVLADRERLLDRLEVDPRARAVIERLLGRVLLAPDLRAAWKLWRAHAGTCTVVTPDGSAIDALGALSGGSGETAEEAALGRRRELHRLAERLAAQEKELGEAQTALEAARCERAAMEARRRELEERAAALAVSRVAAEKDTARLEHEREEMEAAVEACVCEAIAIDREGAELEARLATVEQELARVATERTAADGELDKAQEALAGARERARLEEERLRGLQMQVVAHAERERHLRATLARLEGTAEELARRAAATRERAAALGHEKDERRRREAELREQLAVQGDGLASLAAQLEGHGRRTEELRARLSELRKQADSRRAELEALREERAGVELGLAERQLSLRHLSESLEEKYGSPAHRLLAEADGYEPVDEAAATASIEQLRGRVAQMEGVNLAALEELEELRGRQEFLRVQKEDIERSLGDLRRTISKLTKTSEARFAETFAAANARLAEVFPQLFPGGRAWLRLCEGEGEGEPGVEIVVQPAGKKVQSLGLLSGGEKALSAVALILALFMIRPTPFCLLDEVDAALDEANIGRFNLVARGMAQRSQVVLITHNKRTMEVADTLYGVTMEEAGISKVVAVRLRAAA